MTVGANNLESIVELRDTVVGALLLLTSEETLEGGHIESGEPVRDGASKSISNSSSYSVPISTISSLPCSGGAISERAFDDALFCDLDLVGVFVDDLIDEDNEEGLRSLTSVLLVGRGADGELLVCVDGTVEWRVVIGACEAVLVGAVEL